MGSKEGSPVIGKNRIKTVAQLALAVGLALSADSSVSAAPGHSALDPEPAGEKCWEVFTYIEKTPDPIRMEEWRFNEANDYYPQTPKPDLIPVIQLDCDFNLAEATSPKKE